MRINLSFCGSLLVATLVSTGCGGSGSSTTGGSDEFITDEPSVDNTLTSFVDAGVFNTTVEYAEGFTGDAVSVLSSTGRLITVFDFDDVSVSRIEINENGKFSAPATDIFYDAGWVQNELIVNGQAVSRQIIQGTVESEAGEFQSGFKLERDNALSNQGASLSYINRTFFQQNSETISTTVTVSSDGSVTGSDTTGCVIGGVITVPDEQVNVYEVTLELSRCGAAPGTSAALRNGSFTGLGIFDRTTDELEMVITNGKIVGAFLGS